jgi:hypothetical protein
MSRVTGSNIDCMSAIWDQEADLRSLPFCFTIIARRQQPYVQKLDVSRLRDWPSLFRACSREAKAEQHTPPQGCGFDQRDDSRKNLIEAKEETSDLALGLDSASQRCQPRLD